MTSKREINFDLNSRIGAGNALLGSTTGELFMCNLTGQSQHISETARRKSRDKWIYSGIKGSVCFICDNTGDYHFKILRQSDLKELFSITLQNTTEYLKLSEHFFYFESEEGLIGFNIIDRLEANTFYNIITGKLPKKSKTKLRRGSKTKRKGSKVGFMFFGQTKARKRTMGSKRMQRKSSKSKRRGSKKKKREQLLSISDLTPEWKAFLKESGIRKKDFKKPKVQKLIRNILKQGNISPSPPPLNMTLKEARKYYPNDTDFKNYQKYKNEALKYEQEVEKYETELKKFNFDLYRSSKSSKGSEIVMPRGSKRDLPRPPPRSYRASRKPEFHLEPPQFPALPVIDRVEQELDDFLDDDKFSQVVSMRDAAKSQTTSLPPPPPSKSAPPGLGFKQVEVNTPREIRRLKSKKTVGFANFSRANSEPEPRLDIDLGSTGVSTLPPTVLDKKPSLPTIVSEDYPKVVLDLSLDEPKEETTILAPPLPSVSLTPRNKLTEKEKSEEKTFSVLIQQQKEALTTVTRLPDLGTVKKKDKELLTTLMRNLKSRRDELVSTEDDDDDIESDWSELEEEEDLN